MTNPNALTSAFAVCLTLVSVSSACKTSSSSTKSNEDLASVASMSEAQFITACQERLTDPQEGALTKQMLQQYAQTTDCKTAFPIVQALVAGQPPHN